MPSIVVSLGAPIAVFTLVRSSVDSDTTAFAIGAAVPLLWTLGRFAVSRKVDPIGVFGVVTYGLALLVTWLTGGSPLALELRDAVPTGLLGLACLVSLLVRRPLVHVLLRFAGRWNPALAERARRSEGTAGAVTLMVGVLLVVHAGVLCALAFTLPTAAFLGVHQPVGWAILAVGVAGILWYRRRHPALPEAV